MQERTGLVTMKGNPLTLLGDSVTPGQTAPDFQVVANDLSTVRLASHRGKVCILSVVPSLDTPVCDTQTRTFNQRAAQLGPDIEILTISMDRPFAQKRWCAAAGIDRVHTLSDHRDADFGAKYGLLIKGLRLLARAIIVVDGQGVVRHVELVPEVTHEPDYDAALEAARSCARKSN